MNKVTLQFAYYSCSMGVLESAYPVLTLSCQKPIQRMNRSLCKSGLHVICGKSLPSGLNPRIGIHYTRTELALALHSVGVWTRFLGPQGCQSLQGQQPIEHQEHYWLPWCSMKWRNERFIHLKGVDNWSVPGRFSPKGGMTIPPFHSRRGNLNKTPPVRDFARIMCDGQKSRRKNSWDYGP